MALVTGDFQPFCIENDPIEFASLTRLPVDDAPLCVANSLKEHWEKLQQ